MKRIEHRPVGDMLNIASTALVVQCGPPVQFILQLHGVTVLWNLQGKPRQIVIKRIYLIRLKLALF